MRKPTRGIDFKLLTIYPGLAAPKKKIHAGNCAGVSMSNQRELIALELVPRGKFHLFFPSFPGTQRQRPGLFQ